MMMETKNLNSFMLSKINATLKSFKHSLFLILSLVKNFISEKTEIFETFFLNEIFLDSNSGHFLLTKMVVVGRKWFAMLIFASRKQNVHQRLMSNKLHVQLLLMAMIGRKGLNCFKNLCGKKNKEKFCHLLNDFIISYDCSEKLNTCCKACVF